MLSFLFGVASPLCYWPHWYLSCLGVHGPNSDVDPRWRTFHQEPAIFEACRKTKHQISRTWSKKLTYREVRVPVERTQATHNWRRTTQPNAETNQATARILPPAPHFISSGLNSGSFSSAQPASCGISRISNFTCDCYHHELTIKWKV